MYLSHRMHLPVTVIDHCLMTVAIVANSCCPFICVMGRACKHLLPLLAYIARIASSASYGLFHDPEPCKSNVKSANTMH